MTLIVEAKGLVKTYRMGAVRVPALRGVSLDVAAGEVVAIMGHSSCGKTTLLNCLAGLDTIDDGAISIAGEPLHLLRERRRTAYRARHMGFINITMPTLDSPFRLLRFRFTRCTLS